MIGRCHTQLACHGLGERCVYGRGRRSIVLRRRSVWNMRHGREPEIRDPVQSLDGEAPHGRDPTQPPQKRWRECPGPRCPHASYRRAAAVRLRAAGREGGGLTTPLIFRLHQHRLYLRSEYCHAADNGLATLAPHQRIISYDAGIFHCRRTASRTTKFQAHIGTRQIHSSYQLENNPPQHTDDGHSLPGQKHRPGQ